MSCTLCWPCWVRTKRTAARCSIRRRVGWPPQTPRQTFPTLNLVFSWGESTISGGIYVYYKVFHIKWFYRTPCYAMLAEFWCVAVSLGQQTALPALDQTMSETCCRMTITPTSLDRSQSLFFFVPHNLQKTKHNFLRMVWGSNFWSGEELTEAKLVPPKASHVSKFITSQPSGAPENHSRKWSLVK